MVDRALLASVDALPVREQIELVEHIHGNLSAGTKISKADQELIEARANDTDPSHWLTPEEFKERVRGQFE